MRRSSQIVSLSLLVACGLLTAMLTARTTDSFADGLKPAPHAASKCSKQFGLLDGDSMEDWVADRASDRSSHEPAFLSISGTTDHAGLVYSFRFLLPWSRGGDQSLVRRHVRLQI